MIRGLTSKPPVNLGIRNSRASRNKDKINFAAAHSIPILTSFDFPPTVFKASFQVIDSRAVFSRVHVSGQDHGWSVFFGTIDGLNGFASSGQELVTIANTPMGVVKINLFTGCSMGKVGPIKGSWMILAILRVLPWWSAGVSDRRALVKDDFASCSLGCCLPSVT